MQCVIINSKTSFGIKTNGKEFPKTSLEDEDFFSIRTNYKRTRSHKRSMNNREIDQEKQKKTVARRKLITTET